MIILAFVLSCTSSAKIIRTVAANGQGVDIRGCGIEGNLYCNTTQFAIFESNNGDEIVLLKGIHTCDTNGICIWNGRKVPIMKVQQRRVTIV